MKKSLSVRVALASEPQNQKLTKLIHTHLQQTRMPSVYNKMMPQLPLPSHHLFILSKNSTVYQLEPANNLCLAWASIQQFANFQSFIDEGFTKGELLLGIADTLGFNQQVKAILLQHNTDLSEVVQEKTIFLFLNEEPTTATQKIELNDLKDLIFEYTRDDEEETFDTVCLNIQLLASYPICPKIKRPEGRCSFVVLQHAPHTVYCFHTATLLNDHKLTSLANQFLNFGHSSLANQGNSALDRKYRGMQEADIYAQVVSPVKSAGMLYFNKDGTLDYWNNDSGHFKPMVEDALTNRPGYLQLLLPDNKFQPFTPSASKSPTFSR